MVNWPQIPINSAKEYDMCFGCGRNNPIGFRLSFTWDGKTARAEFTPTELYQGWSGFVHGGIIICMLDEAMGYAALFGGKHCITARMESRIRCPASIDVPLIITSSITKNTRRLVETSAAVSLKDGTVVAEGTATQFVIGTEPGSTARRKGRSENGVER
jgi:acyl-coenzyme A thioesterase PaaI-like protein